MSRLLLALILTAGGVLAILVVALLVIGLLAILPTWVVIAATGLAIFVLTYNALGEVQDTGVVRNDKR